MRWNWLLWALLHILSLNFCPSRAAQYQNFLSNLLNVVPEPSFRTSFNETFTKDMFTSRPKMVLAIIRWRNRFRARQSMDPVRPCDVITLFESFRASSSYDGKGCHKMENNVQKSHLRIQIVGKHDKKRICRVRKSCVLGTQSEISASQNGFNTYVWGPIVWALLHILSFHAKDSLTPLERHQFLLSMSAILPCKACRENFSSNFFLALSRFHCAASPFSKEYFPYFIYRLHDAVNLDLGKATPSPSFDTVKKIYGRREIQNTYLSVTLEKFYHPKNKEK